MDTHDQDQTDDKSITAVELMNGLEFLLDQLGKDVEVWVVNKDGTASAITEIMEGDVTPIGETKRRVLAILTTETPDSDALEAATKPTN